MFSSGGFEDLRPVVHARRAPEPSSECPPPYHPFLSVVLLNEVLGHFIPGSWFDLCGPCASPLFVTAFYTAVRNWRVVDLRLMDND